LLLERKDIGFLSPSDRRPSCNGFLCRNSSGTGIPDDPADQASVCSRDTVMLIYIQLRKSTDIYFKFIICRKRIAELIIQTMDSLDHKNIFLTQLEKISPVLSFACFKIINRKFYPLPF